MSVRLSPAFAPEGHSLVPEQILFMGDYVDASEKEDFAVRLLCWPVTGAAWDSLVRSWVQLRELRNDRGIANAVAPKRSSWVTESAPQLAGVFREASTEENTIATLLARAHIQFAVDVSRVDRKPAWAQEPTPPLSPSLASCLAIYDEFLKVPGRQACLLVVARSRGMSLDQMRTEEFIKARAQLPYASWLDSVRFRCWTDVPEPLPLEIAHLAGVAIARHLQLPAVVNPIFDAVLSKLVRIPPEIANLTSSGRR